MNDEKVVLLTEVDENRKPIVKSMGIVNLTVFRGIDDALYHIFLTSAEGSSINILKRSKDFGWVVVENEKMNKKVYYELHYVKPLSYK